MYHIWAAQCQIQLARGQYPDHPDRFGLLAVPDGRIELFDAVQACFRRMHKRNDAIPLERGLDLTKPHRNEPGFSRHSECVEGGSFEQRFGAINEIAGNPDVAPKSASKGAAFDRLVQRASRRSYPYAAAGQLVLEVSDGFAIRCN